jgi:hypothetical protein
MGEDAGYSGQISEESIKIRDLEEKQRILKDRLLLIGQNLIDTKEKHNEKLMETKRDMETIKNDLEKIKSFLETISGEFSKFARKEDLEILSKQAKMFQPLEFATKKDLEKLKRDK